MIVSPQQHEPYDGFRIKLVVSLEKENAIKTRNELLIPGVYENLHDALKDIQLDISRRLSNSLYFRSTKFGYDLVKYSNLASVNTYLSYRIVPVKAREKKIHRQFFEESSKELESP